MNKGLYIARAGGVRERAALAAAGLAIAVADCWFRVRSD